MRCVSCKKMVPSASTRCPYCGGEVTDKNDIEETPITSTESVQQSTSSSSNKIDFVELLTDPDKKKLVLIGGGILVFFIFMIIIVASLSGSKPKMVTNYKAYSKLFDKVEDFLSESFFDNSYVGSGTYDFYIKYNKDINEFSGKYNYDLKNKIINITASAKNPDENKGVIIVDFKKFDSELNFNKGELYYSSEQITDKPILFKFDDKDGYLSNTRYDMNDLVVSFFDSLEEALKKMNYGTTTETVQFLGESAKFDKLYFKLNNEGRKTFYTTFYNSLADDSSFTSEMGKIQGKKSSEIEEIYRNYATSAEYAYSGSGDANTVVSLYTKNNQFKRFEINNQDDSNLKKIYRIDVDDSRYHFYYMENGKTIYEGSLLILTNEINGVVNRKYEITLDSSKFNIDINLNVKLDSKPKVELKDNLEGTKFIDLTDEEKGEIKTKLGEFIKNTKFFDKLDDIFIDKCSLASDCKCNDKEPTCSCLYNKEVIQCPNPDLNKPKEDTVDENEINKTTTTTTTTESTTTSTVTTTTTATN